MKKTLVILLAAFTVTACTPLVPVDTTTTTTTTTTTDGYILRPSGGDDTDRLVAAVTANPVVTVDGKLKMLKVPTITASGRVINFKPGSALVRSTRPEVRTFQMLKLLNSTNITINNLQIEGPNIKVCDFLYIPPPPTGPMDLTDQTPYWILEGYDRNYESQHGVEIYGGSGITINGGNVYGMSGDGIYIAGQAQNISIKNVSTLCTGRSSISNVGSSNVTVTGGSFKRSGYWIFNVEPDVTSSVSNYLIDRPTVGHSNFRWFFSSGPYYSCLVTNVIVYKPILQDVNPNPPLTAECAQNQVHIIYQ